LNFLNVKTLEINVLLISGCTPEVYEDMARYE